MCAIIGSFDPKTILKLVDANSYRGNFSWSITGIDKNNYIDVTNKGFGEFPKDLFLELSNEYADYDLYWLCHVQSPTGGQVNDVDRIHPAKNEDFYLWHNGVIKTKWMEKQPNNNGFDTKLMVDKIKHNETSNSNSDLDLSESLKDIDGSFACALLYEGVFLKIFRNSASPLFVNGTDISSAKMPDMEKIESGVLYLLDIDYKEITPCGEFENINKPFYFG